MPFDLSLKIRNFKKINNEVCLKGFTTVNYFVGSNGSGKSSILLALSCLGDGRNAIAFFGSDSMVEFKQDEDTKYIRLDDEYTTSSQGGAFAAVIIADHGTIRVGGRPIERKLFNYEEFERKEFEFMNTTSEYLGFPEMKVKRYMNPDNPWDTTNGKRVFEQDGKQVDPKLLASGFKSFNDIRYSINQALENVPDQHAHPVLVIIEEPENNLHPALQKRRPQFFDEISKEYKVSKDIDLHFFVATHSPFIIGAAANYDNQKVYLLEEGSLVDLKKNNILESEGYIGQKCARVVGSMLGSNVTDLGYPENYCILEEYSLQLILEDARDKSILQNFQFVSASGITKAESLAKTVNELANLNTLIKCNPYYCDKYILVVDSLVGLDSTTIKKLNDLREKIGPRFVELQSSGIEDYYQNIDRDIFNDATTEINTLSPREQGPVKSKYAQLISSRINTREDFSRLFNNELDRLLR